MALILRTFLLLLLLLCKKFNFVFRCLPSLLITHYFPQHVIHALSFLLESRTVSPVLYFRFFTFHGLQFFLLLFSGHLLIRQNFCLSKRTPPPGEREGRGRGQRRPRLKMRTRKDKITNETKCRSCALSSGISWHSPQPPQNVQKSCGIDILSE